MAGRELQRRAASPTVSWRDVRAARQIATEGQLAQCAIRAVSAVAEYGACEAAYLKKLQRQLEGTDPDAADAVAAIINTAVFGIARRVGRFASEVD